MPEGDEIDNICVVHINQPLEDLDKCFLKTNKKFIRGNPLHIHFAVVDTDLTHLHEQVWVDFWTIGVSKNIVFREDFDGNINLSPSRDPPFNQNLHSSCLGSLHELPVGVAHLIPYHFHSFLSVHCQVSRVDSRDIPSELQVNEHQMWWGRGQWVYVAGPASLLVVRENLSHASNQGKMAYQLTKGGERECNFH